MAFREPNLEHKQHISLSNQAFTVITNDMHAFQVEKKSTFINKIIENYKITAETTLSKSSERYRNTLENKLSNTVESSKKIIDALTNDYIKITKKKYCKAPKDVSFKIRINNENYNYLFSECDDCNEEQYYNDNSGEYIKAILEEYASKDFVYREQIYASHFFTAINDAINSEKTLSVIFTNGNKVKVRPYKIITDPLSMYHYLIGLKITNGNKGMIKETFSCRISNLNKVYLLSEHSFISKAEQNILDSNAREKGVQFLCEELEEFIVYLTDKGITMYNRILHLRPTYSKIEDIHTYYFKCSFRQIEFYFFKFGAEAVIQAPLSRQNIFCNSYEAAVQAYKQT